MTDPREERSRNYVSQVKASFFFRAGAVLASFLAIPIAIEFLGAELFGVWATMNALISWVMMFDLGIGNGLKNKVSESLAKGDPSRAAKYISAAYVVIGGVAIVLFSLLFVVSLFVPWLQIFNTNNVVVSEKALWTSVVLFSFFICLNFWLTLVNQIYFGLSRAAVVFFGQLVSSTLALLFVIALNEYFSTSIVFFALAYGLALVCANFCLSVLLFYNHKELIPQFKSFGRNEVAPLCSLGTKFFLIQLSVLVLFMSDKIIIAQLLGPEEVTPYEVLFKFFSVILVAHGLILAPLWPAYTNAYVTKDFHWIRYQLARQVLVALCFFGIAALFAVIGPTVVSVWIGSGFEVIGSLYFLFAAYIGFTVWSNVFSYFINAIGDLNLQLATALVAACLNPLLSICFVKFYGMGVEGVVLATIFSLSIYGIFGPIQVLRIIR